MIVVADAGPLNYLVLIGAVDVMRPLYGRVLVPQTVADELLDANTPPTVRAWIAQAPQWCEIRPDPPSDPEHGWPPAPRRYRGSCALRRGSGYDGYEQA